MKPNDCRSHFFFILILAGLTPMLLAGCGLMLQPVERDVEIGRETAQQVAAEMGIVQDPEGTQYLNALGQRLVKVNPDRQFEYNFAIVDQYVPNAFALPGGFVYVSRGLLVLTNNEDELANVVGHEIIHVSQRHSAKQMAKARVPALLSLPGAIVGGVVSRDLGNLINAPVNIIGGAYLAAHSRQDEFEADQLGQRLAAAAGYDPAKLAPILAHLEGFVNVQTGEKRIPGFFDTHPSTPDRVERVRRDARSISWTRTKGIASNSAAYLRQLDGLIVGDDPALGVFQEQLFLQPDLDFSVMFPKDWKAVNTRQTVYAISPEEDSVMALGIAGKGTDPKEVAVQHEEAMVREYGIKPSISKSETVGKLPAYLLAYTDDSGKETMHLAFLWIAYRGLIYECIGLVPDRLRNTARTAAFSFRPLSAVQRDSIRATRLRVVTARADESLAQLSKRTENRWDAKTTAVVNGIGENQKLKNGQLVKVAVVEPYRKK
jgi:predicted Zn-dependent protease